MTPELPRAGAIADGVHRFPVRVYYEDTDAAGIVYYANYLKFAERARAEMIRGFRVAPDGAAREAEAHAFVVRRAEIEFEAPARLDDELVVETRIAETGAATVLLQQDVARGRDILVRAAILLACVGRNGRPRRLPPPLRAALRSHQKKPRMVPAHAR